jgi:hypothetical protein
MFHFNSNLIEKALVSLFLVGLFIINTFTTIQHATAKIQISITFFFQLGIFLQTDMPLLKDVIVIPT